MGHRGARLCHLDPSKSACRLGGVRIRELFGDRRLAMGSPLTSPWLRASPDIIRKIADIQFCLGCVPAIGSSFNKYHERLTWYFYDRMRKHTISLPCLQILVAIFALVFGTCALAQAQLAGASSPALTSSLHRLLGSTRCSASDADLLAQYGFPRRPRAGLRLLQSLVAHMAHAKHALIIRSAKHRNGHGPLRRWRSGRLAKMRRRAGSGSSKPIRTRISPPNGSGGSDFHHGCFRWHRELQLRPYKTLDMGRHGWLWF